MNSDKITQKETAINIGRIDSRAVIYPTAKIDPTCSVGPYAVLGPDVSLGPGCAVHAHAVVQGPAVLGANNIVHSFACLGGPPQDLRYKGERTLLVIGDKNEFREHVTVNRGTVHGGGITSIGNNNLLMAYCHVAHDCEIGNNVIMANHTTLAGHVKVEDYVFFGGMAAVGSFLRVGKSAMLAAGAMAEREVPPYCIVSGDRARLRAVNRVGLDRRGFSKEAKAQIHAIFKCLKTKGMSIADIVCFANSLETLTEEAEHMLDFMSKATRGLTR